MPLSGIIGMLSAINQNTVRLRSEQVSAFVGIRTRQSSWVFKIDFFLVIWTPDGIGGTRDYVEGMWRILQQPVPDDYILATGEAHSVREFVEKAFACVGRGLDWRGSGVDEKGVSGRIMVEVDPRYFRPTEVDILLGDPTKARKKLGWHHEVSFEALVREMVETDLAAVKLESARRSRHE
jgi:GDP-mannose 4,6 dehydratase